MGVTKADRRAFFEGEVVPFQYATKGGDDVEGFLQFADGRLKSQLFFIRDETGGAPAAFRKFMSNSREIAKTTGADVLELQGGTVINENLAAGLLDRGFKYKWEEAPPQLGGGNQQVLYKLFDL